MAKQAKKTRKSLYNEILSKQGKKLEQCAVLGFRFQKVYDAHSLHFELMNNHVEYIMFDLTEDGNAIIIFDNLLQAETIRTMAEWAGGTEYKPNLNL